MSAEQVVNSDAICTFIHERNQERQTTNMKIMPIWRDETEVKNIPIAGVAAMLQWCKRWFLDSSWRFVMLRLHLHHFILIKLRKKSDLELR